jgi:hypothetical protein
MEFRFVKGGDSAMFGTFAEDPEHTWFVNLDARRPWSKRHDFMSKIAA